jgi:FMN reductase
MTVKVAIVVGNPKPQSRTLRVAETLIEKLFVASSCTIEVVDLAERAAEMFAWPSEELAAVNARVADSDVAVFASPTYKATFTGLLKAFLDRYPANGLEGVVALPVMTGADLTHSMGVNVNLVPLLVELGAVVPGRGLYFVTSQMDRLDELVEAAAGEYARNLGRLSRVAESASAVAEAVRS